MKLIPENTKAFLYAVAAVLLWSTVATAFKLSLKGMNYIQLLFYASFTSSVVLFLIALRNSRKQLSMLFQGENIKRNLLLGFINPFLYYLVLFKAYSLLPAQEAQALNYTWPIAIAVFASLFLKHKLTVKTLTGLIISFAGVLIISTRGKIFSLEFHNLYGVILATGSSLIWATFWILNLKDERDSSVKLFAAFLTGCIYSGIYILLFDSFEIKDATFLLGAVYVGLFEMGITFFLWMKGLQLSKDKAKTSTLAYLSPFISLIFIALILNEKILPSSIIGLIFIIGGILYQHIEISNKPVKES